eukprot:scaffold217355_cov46-Attheya_sp.AAC.4
MHHCDDSIDAPDASSSSHRQMYSCSVKSLSLFLYFILLQFRWVIVSPPSECATERAQTKDQARKKRRRRHAQSTTRAIILHDDVVMMGS